MSHEPHGQHTRDEMSCQLSLHLFLSALPVGLRAVLRHVPTRRRATHVQRADDLDATRVVAQMSNTWTATIRLGHPEGSSAWKEKQQVSDLSKWPRRWDPARLSRKPMWSTSLAPRVRSPLRHAKSIVESKTCRALRKPRSRTKPRRVLRGWWTIPGHGPANESASTGGRARLSWSPAPVADSQLCCDCCWCVAVGAQTASVRLLSTALISSLRRSHRDATCDPFQPHRCP